MPRVRVSTTVDGDLLTEARARRAGVNDSALCDVALTALVRASRAAEMSEIVLEPGEEGNGTWARPTTIVLGRVSDRAALHALRGVCRGPEPG